MLYEPYTAPPRRDSFVVPILAGMAALVVVLVGGAFLFSGGSAATVVQSAPAIPVSLKQWKIESKWSDLNRRMAPGQVLFVPAGVDFSILAEPMGAKGMFVERSGAASWDHEGGELNPAREGNGYWAQDAKAPQQPGLYQLVWKDLNDNTMTLHSLQVLVMGRAEASTRGDRTTVKVDGKSIGQYLDPTKSPVKRVRENAHLYHPPQYFTSIQNGLDQLKLGPDFELGNLIAFKDYYGNDGKKVYTTQRHTDVLPARADLIDKLVRLRQRLRDKGVKVTRFWVTSGFRTPDYNKSIGGAAYSRHCFGDAVDICIDEDGDKHMDDLNGDGKLDRKDGIIIGDACRELELEGAVVPGGIGVYEWSGEESVRSHVHIDCRGYVSRWGTAGRRSFVWWPKGEFSEEEGGD